MDFKRYANIEALYGVKECEHNGVKTITAFQKITEKTECAEVICCECGTVIKIVTRKVQLPLLDLTKHGV